MATFNIYDKVQDKDLYKEYPGTTGTVISIKPIIVQYWDIQVRYNSHSDIIHLTKLK